MRRQLKALCRGRNLPGLLLLWQLRDVAGRAGTSPRIPNEVGGAVASGPAAAFLQGIRHRRHSGTATGTPRDAAWGAPAVCALPAAQDGDHSRVPSPVPAMAPGTALPSHLGAIAEPWEELQT